VRARREHPPAKQAPAPPPPPTREGTSETIFLVVGSAGEYDEHKEWLVAAYRDRGLAQQHADLARGAFRAAQQSREAALFDEPGGDYEATSNFDPHAALDRGSGHYEVTSIELREVVPSGR